MSNFTYTKRKDGRLMKKVSVNGKTKYIYATSVQDLKKQYEKLQYLKYNGISFDDILLKDFCTKWLEVNSANKENGTIKEYTFLLDKFIIPKLGYMKIKNIKIYHIQDMMKDMEDIPTTAKKTLQLTKRILNYAVDNDVVIKNVAQYLKAPKIIKKEKRPLTLEEDAILLNSTNKYTPYFLMMRYTGLRKEEVSALNIKNVNLKERSLTINEAVTFINNQPHLKTTKNGKKRIVPIPDIIYPMTCELVKNAQNNLLFYKESDKMMLTDSAIKRHLESFCYQNNISFTCHQLRHSYCTMLYYAGVKIKEAQELMGHSSAKMVYDIYTHLDSTRENTTELINNYLNGCQKVVK